MTKDTFLFTFLVNLKEAINFNLLALRELFELGIVSLIDCKLAGRFGKYLAFLFDACDTGERSALNGIEW